MFGINTHPHGVAEVLYVWELIDEVGLGKFTCFRIDFVGMDGAGVNTACVEEVGE